MELGQLKGTRDYLPEEQIFRERIKEILIKNFQKYGYQPMETSILEFYDLAASKYAGGLEILKETYCLTDQGGRKLCLRYELTFKLAKLIGLNPDIRFPLKRYEIGKVFRDGPVKTGRLREFTQCDVDVVGIKSSIVDAELMALTDDIFSDLNLKVFIQVNNRNLLFGLFEFLKFKRPLDLALSLDKLEKVGKEAVKKELKEKGFEEKKIGQLFSFFEKVEKKKSNKEKLDYLEKEVRNELARKGIKELKEFFAYCRDFGIKENLVFNPLLARGLAYYTGLMWEAYLQDSEIKSSVAAGGRWDRMIQQFLESEREYPATGMTFGLDVIYQALKEKKFKIENIPKVLVIPIETLEEAIRIISRLRKEGINSDLAFEKKLAKALEWADKKEIPYCLIIGEDELKEKKFRLRIMKERKERLLDWKKLIRILQ